MRAEGQEKVVCCISDMIGLLSDETTNVGSSRSSWWLAVIVEVVVLVVAEVV